MRVSATFLLVRDLAVERLQVARISYRKPPVAKRRTFRPMVHRRGRLRREATRIHDITQYIRNAAVASVRKVARPYPPDASARHRVRDGFILKHPGTLMRQRWRIFGDGTAFSFRSRLHIRERRHSTSNSPGRRGCN